MPSSGARGRTDCFGEWATRLPEALLSRLYDFLGARERTEKQEQFPRNGRKNTELSFPEGPWVCQRYLTENSHTGLGTGARSLFQKSMIRELHKAKQQLRSRYTNAQDPSTRLLLGKGSRRGLVVVEVDSLLLQGHHWSSRTKVKHAGLTCKRCKMSYDLGQIISIF